LKLGAFSGAASDSKAALEIEPTSVKGFFRLGQALSEQKEFDQAKNAFNKALEQEPNNKAVQTELAKVDQKATALKKKQQKVFSGMFGSE